MKSILILKIINYHSILKLIHSYQIQHGLDININDRFLFLNHIKNINSIIKKYDYIHYDIKNYSSYQIFITTGSKKYIDDYEHLEFNLDNFLSGISDTTDDLYDECLFKLAKHNLTEEIYNSIYFECYIRNKFGFIIDFSYKKNALAFDTHHELLFGDRKIEWILPFTKDSYICQIYMNDYNGIVEYIPLKQLASKNKPTTKHNIKKENKQDKSLLELLKSYKPSDNEKEMYDELLMKLENN